MDKILGISIVEHHGQENAFCPGWGAQNSCHGNATGSEGPKSGDVSICALCGALMIFGEDISRRLATPEEQREILADAQNGKLVALAITRAKAARQMRLRQNFRSN
jgi:hypothetical protein